MGGVDWTGRVSCRGVVGLLSSLFLRKTIIIIKAVWFRYESEAGEIGYSGAVRLLIVYTVSTHLPPAAINSSSRLSSIEHILSPKCMRTRHALPDSSGKGYFFSVDRAWQWSTNNCRSKRGRERGSGGERGEEGMMEREREGGVTG